MSGSVMTTMIHKVRDAAASEGGGCIAPFSQAFPPVSVIIGADEAVKDGICQALVNRWISAHAAGGSLWNTLYPTPMLNVAALSGIIAEQKASEAPLPESRRDGIAVGGAAAQIRHNEMWLGRHGLLPWHSSMLNASGGFGTAETTYDMMKRLCDTIVSFQPSDGAYLNIAMTGRGGHAMGMFIGGMGFSGKREFLFFDPNLGEFYFDERDKFRRWFGRGFVATMSRAYAFKAFTVHAFAPRARALAGPLQSRGRSRAVFGRH